MALPLWIQSTLSVVFLSPLSSYTLFMHEQAGVLKDGEMSEEARTESHAASSGCLRWPSGWEVDSRVSRCTMLETARAPKHHLSQWGPKESPEADCSLLGDRVRIASNSTMAITVMERRECKNMMLGWIRRRHV